LTPVKESAAVHGHPIYCAVILQLKEVIHVKPEVEKVLESIRPHLQADGGDVELVDVEGGVVKVRLLGACGGCPMATMTLKGGIEAALKERIPAVERVESV
jgi:Fe-S cluster biogenesis protein NfuA